MIRSNLNINIFFIIKVILIYLFLCLKSYSDNISTDTNFIVLGPDKAPVKIKIFSSLTCPHCAHFHINVVPEIKKEYIESGIKADFQEAGDEDVFRKIKADLKDHNVSDEEIRNKMKELDEKAKSDFI